ncbi:hypothetical protein [Haloarcula marina]|uniref:hypothetical protein n=1 Tax=Haloarcula marina TaxID=2961574 RepID=UPI0020B7918D|nr:hypothetical protein [Halomicroarcula marina]
MSREHIAQPSATGTFRSGTVHVGRAQSLLDRAHRERPPTDLVMTPEQLHKRNLNRALAAARRPRTSMLVRTPVEVAGRIAGDDRTVLDRLDRRRLLDDVLADPPDAVERLRAVVGSDLAAAAERVEALREERLLLTGRNPEREAAVRDICAQLPSVVAADTRDAFDGIRAVERTVRERAAGFLGPGAVIEAATERLRATDGDAWAGAFPNVERVTLAGVSTLGTPLLDFLDALAATTDTAVHLYLRAGTGPQIAARLDERLLAEDAGGRSCNVRAPTLESLVDATVTELIARTRDEEARAVAALVDGVLQSGVSPSDIAVVARDADAYERHLARAMPVYGRHLSVWTQLDLDQSLPYRLVVATCDLLAAAATDDVDAATLCRPLRLQWTAPRGTGSSPVSHAGLSAVERAIGDGEPASLSEWTERLLREVDSDETARRRVLGLVNWCRQQPTTPAPEDVVGVLGPIADAFDDNVLPKRADRDGPDYTETARTARAVERVAGVDGDDHLLRETRAKYDDWLARSHVERSWETVRDVLDAIATARPGRREHDNAERIDVLDATDTWLRTYPYVVAVGFVDGEWPRRPRGALPAEFRTAVVDGDSQAARHLGVRGAWTEAREYDHLADAVSTASAHLVVTRFTEDVDGVAYQRSPLLDGLEPAVVGADEYNRLIAGTGLPDRLAATVESEVVR